MGLEKTPHETPTSRVLQHNPHTLHPAAREEAVQALLEALRQRVHTRRVLVKPFFADYEQQVITLPLTPTLTSTPTLAPTPALPLTPTLTPTLTLLLPLSPYPYP